MSKEDVIIPLEVKLRARMLYLSGVLPKKISEELKVNLATIYQWVRRGDWKEERQRFIRFLEKKELRRLAKDMAKELRSQGAILNRAQAVIESRLYKPEVNAGGEETGRHILKEVMDYKVSSDDAMVNFMLQLVSKKEAHIKLTSDLLGEYYPKIDPAEVKMPADLGTAGLPEPVVVPQAPPPEEKKEDPK